MSKKPTDRIEAAVREIHEAMSEGQFTRQELEAIKRIAQTIIGATDKALARGAVHKRGG